MRADRQALLHHIADAILRAPSPCVTRAGVDGVDGAGKTVFGDQIAAALRWSGLRRRRR